MVHSVIYGYRIKYNVCPKMGLNRYLKMKRQTA